MLVRCPSCGVSVDHKLRRCSLCKADLELAGDQLVASLVEDAEQWVREGMRLSGVRRQLLLVPKLTEQQVEDILQRIRATGKRDSRAQGRRLLLLGSVLVLVSLLIAAITFAITNGKVSVWAIGMLLVGLAMVTLGQLKVVTGWNLTGHDDQ